MTSPCAVCGHPAGRHWNDGHRHCSDCPGPEKLCAPRVLVRAKPA